MDRMDSDNIDPERVLSRPSSRREAERADRFSRTSAGARKVAVRLEDDPTTMAWVLARYREAEDADDALIAISLGIDQARIPHLALCSRPRDELFRSDIETIAEHIGMDPLALAEVVRRVDAVTGFGQRPRGHRGGILAAARDRAAEDPATYDPGGSPSSAAVSSPSSTDVPVVATPDHEDER